MKTIDSPVIAIIFIVNICVALLARFKILKRSYRPELSQEYAQIWGFVALLQYIIAMCIFKGFSKTYTYFAIIFSITLGFIIYFIFRKGYETDIFARQEDFYRLKSSFKQLAKYINKDIEELELILSSIDNIDHKQLRLSIQEIQLFMCSEDVFLSDSTILVTLKQLFDSYINCADAVIRVREYATTYKTTKAKKQDCKSYASVLQSEFANLVELIKEEQSDLVNRGNH